MITLSLYSKPHYTFITTLSNKSYLFSFNWSVYESAWYFDLKSLSDTSVDLKGVKCCGGVDLIGSHGLIDLGQLWCLDLSGQYRDPTFDSISVDFVLGYIE